LKTLKRKFTYFCGKNCERNKKIHTYVYSP